MGIEGVRDFKSIVWLEVLGIHKGIGMGLETPTPIVLLTGEGVGVGSELF
jgi:hypothetical protein